MFGSPVRWIRYKSGTWLFLKNLWEGASPPTWGLPAYPSLIYDNYFLILHLCGGILFEFHNNAAADMKCFQAGSGLPEAAFIKISFCPYFMFIAAIFN